MNRNRNAAGSTQEGKFDGNAFSEGVRTLSEYKPLKASLDMVKRRSRPKVLVISNCQTFGIVNSMLAYTDAFEIEGIPVTELGGKTDEDFINLFRPYHHVFVSSLLARLSRLPELESKTITIPAFYFQGYHPDAIMLTANGKSLHGPIGGYQSSIVYAAFCAGLSKEQTLTFFDANFFEKAGHFAEWQAAKAELFEQFRLLGFSAETHFYRWCAQGAFMHTVNHPKIRVLTSLARDMLQKIGCAIENEPEEVVDQLGNGAVFPVYPEIAARTGARGSYRFKPHNLNETLNLREFIELSFEAYRNSDPETRSVHPAYQPRFDAVAALIRDHQGSLPK